MNRRSFLGRVVGAIAAAKVAPKLDFGHVPAGDMVVQRLHDFDFPAYVCSGHMFNGHDCNEHHR